MGDAYTEWEEAEQALEDAFTKWTEAARTIRAARERLDKARQKLYLNSNHPE